MAAAAEFLIALPKEALLFATFCRPLRLTIDEMIFITQFFAHFRLIQQLEKTFKAFGEVWPSADHVEVGHLVRPAAMAAAVWARRSY